jgi:glucose 1-dehydrogenase
MLCTARSHTPGRVAIGEDDPMQALVTVPGQAGATRVADVPEPSPTEGTVLVRPLEIGVCGTDREISEGLFGVVPDGEDQLVLGHEMLGRVERDAQGFARGDLVTATVRRSCGHCAPCAQGAPDSCDTGDYLERGITRLHGFAAELVAEAPEHLVPVPATLGRLGVLAEPASVCERGLRHVRAIGGRQPWGPRRALVIGTGAIGMLATYLLRMDGLEVWAAQLGQDAHKERLVQACGARFVASDATPLRDLAADVGGFDVVLEAAGDAQIMLDALALLRRNGVACLLGIDGRPRDVCIDGRVLGVDAILQNRAIFGSVNANRVDWSAAVARLDAARAHWPEALEAFVGLRVALDAYADAFAYRGVKATLELEGRA